MHQEAADLGSSSVESRKRTVSIRTASLAILQLLACVTLSLVLLGGTRSNDRYVVWFLAIPAFLVGGAVIAYRLFRISETNARKAHITSGWIPWSPWFLLILIAVAVLRIGLDVRYVAALSVVILATVTIAIAHRAPPDLPHKMKLKYEAPRPALFHSAFAGIVSVRSRTPLGVLSILSGMIGAALIITQILIFIIAWVIVEVVGPVLDLVMCGPFRSFAGVVVRANSQVRRYSLAIAWAAIGAVPGVVITMAATRFMH